MARPRFDLPVNLTLLMKQGIGRPPAIVPARVDAPVSAAHKEKLKSQIAKAAYDYYYRITQIDPDLAAAFEDFDRMEYTPEIASALDIYSDECLTKDEENHSLRINTENQKIKQELERLFYDVLDIDANLWAWTRNMCKYGNAFLLLDIDTEKARGVVGYMEMPVREIRRIEAYDSNLNSVKFEWVTQNEQYDAWQVAHFRLLHDSRHYPYGTSILDSSRRIWKQLSMAEDAMLVYRITRAPERRIFYVDVGNIDPNDIPGYVEKIKQTIKKTPAIDHGTGGVNFKYNPMAVDEDYVIPRRNDRSSSIETLPGASNLDEIADIEYLQGKLFAALKIPKAFLTYEEDINAKATLSGQDFRFARTINRIQNNITSELKKIALIHLFSIGIRKLDELTSFDLQLTSPNTQLELEQLEVWNAKADTLSNLWSEDTISPISLVWGLRNLFGFTDADIKTILRQQKIEGKIGVEIADIGTPDFVKDAGGEAPPGADRGDSNFGESISRKKCSLSNSLIDEMLAIKLPQASKPTSPIIRESELKIDSIAELTDSMDLLIGRSTPSNRKEKK